MSRHEGVSCDSCLKGNFRGKRYKCLICYDYDLCATCYEAGATTTRHTTDHPMQCILTRTDFELYYGGEALTAEQPQAFTCPYCGKMGYTETTLQEHVTTDHADSSVEVVCPVCAALPGGDPNHVTDDFAAHLTLEHRAPRDFDEPIGGGIRHVRRIPHPGRGMGGTRARRTNMHFQSAGSTLAGLSHSSSRETMDPIAELLSQLSSVRNRAAAAQNVSSQLQQLEAQLQSTRYSDSRAAVTHFLFRTNSSGSSATPQQQLERLPRRGAEAAAKATSNSAHQQAGSVVMDFAGAVANNAIAGASTSSSSSNSNSQFLLSRYGEADLTEHERQSLETERSDRSLFVQELLLSTLAEGLRLEDQDSVNSSDSDSEFQSLGLGASALENDRSTSDGAGVTGLNNAGRNSPRDKVNHPRRNMVKIVDGKRQLEKEPPSPAVKH